jgi:hypothetical protein
MECFNHAGAPSVAACEECHKHLCRICAVDLGSFVLCPTCFSNFIAMQEKHIRSLRRRFIVGIVLVVLFVLPYVRGIGSFSDLTELLLLALWILSFPISLYMMRGAPDPYVPTSFSAAGNLALFHWFTAMLIAPVNLMRAYRSYHDFSVAVASNKTHLEDVIKAGSL